MPHTGTTWPSQLSPDEDSYLGEVSRRLLGVLGEDLVAVYLTGVLIIARQQSRPVKTRSRSGLARPDERDAPKVPALQG